VNVFLLRAIRIVIRADSDPVRQALFANLRQSRLPVRLVFGLHELLGRTPASGLLVSLYGLAFLVSIAPPRKRHARILTVARHANARRQVARVVSWLGPDACDSVETRLRAGFITDVVSALRRTPGRLKPATTLKALRIIRWTDRVHGFLVACRVAGALAWYVRSIAILGACRPQAVLVSSDSNPEELAFTAAARAVSLPTVFMSHSYPTPFSPPLDYSLSILGGDAEVQARREKGPIKGELLLVGLEGDSAPLDARHFAAPDPVIGIFTPKAVSWPTLAAVISDCRQRFGARQILIRWHPSMLERPHLGDWLADRSGVVETPREAALVDVARHCNWVIAYENSGVHLPVLKLGIPTIAVKNLGLYPESRSDMYGFVRHGVIPPPVSSLGDLHPDALAEFFADGWAARFQEYDASYLRPQHLIAAAVRDAIRRLCDHVASRTSFG